MTKLEIIRSMTEEQSERLYHVLLAVGKSRSGELDAILNGLSAQDLRVLVDLLEAELMERQNPSGQGDYTLD